MALGLACVGGRLVFESVVFPYYLLATSVLFFLLDLVARRTPHRSLAWSAAAAFFVAISPGNRAVDAMGTLILAVLAVAAGLTEVARLSGSHAAKAPPVEVTSDSGVSVMRAAQDAGAVRRRTRRLPQAPSSLNCPESSAAR